MSGRWALDGRIEQRAVARHYLCRVCHIETFPLVTSLINTLMRVCCIDLYEHVLSLHSRTVI